MKPKGKRIATFMLAAAIVTHPIGTVAFAAEIPRFSDVASDHWAYPYIEDMVGQGFFTGTGGECLFPGAGDDARDVCCGAQPYGGRGNRQRG